MTAAHITLTGLSESDHRALLRKVVIASTVIEVRHDPPPMA